MTHPLEPSSVVVGIDGSDAADPQRMTSGSNCSTPKARRRQGHRQAGQSGNGGGVGGTPQAVLINESRRAAMICVGSVGIGCIARMLLGWTARHAGQHGLLPGGAHSQPQRYIDSGYRLDRRHCR